MQWESRHFGLYYAVLVPRDFSTSGILSYCPNNVTRILSSNAVVSLGAGLVEVQKSSGYRLLVGGSWPKDLRARGGHMRVEDNHHRSSAT